MRYMALAENHINTVRETTLILRPLATFQLLHEIAAQISEVLSALGDLGVATPLVEYL